jgi:5-methylcytosine-specific restriction enzyme subunit McrC
LSLPPATFYALLCWAWRIPPEPASVLRETGLDAASTPPDLLARWLCREVERVLRRGLEQRYEERDEVLRHPRGRPDVSAAVQTLAFSRAELPCRYDELTTDTAANRLLRAVLRRVLVDPTLTDETRSRVRRTFQRLPRWPDLRPTGTEFDALRLTRSTPYYVRALHVARLLAEAMVPTPGGDRIALDAWDLDSDRMGRVFQAAMRHLLEVRAPAWRVAAGRHRFQGRLGDHEDPVVPALETDIELTLRSDPAVHRVVECKCTSHAYVERYGKRTLRSEHLYQLLAYLSNAAARGRRPSGGVLLYGTVGAVLGHRLVLDGWEVDVVGVDLGGTWAAVEGVVGGIVEVPRTGATGGRSVEDGAVTR